MDKLKLVQEIVEQLRMGNPSIAVETTFKGRKTKPLLVAVLVIEVTRELIAGNNYRLLQQYESRLNEFHTNNVQF